MKVTFLLPFCLVQICHLVQAATFDDFSNGSFTLFNGIPGSNISTIPSSPADKRWVRADGLTDWSVGVDTESGTLNYSLDIPRGNPSPTQHLQITYYNSLGDLNLQGFDSFVIHVVNLVETGSVIAFVGVTSPPVQAASVSLNTSGDLVIPFSNMHTINSTTPSEISFWIIPDSPDFSVTISSISVVSVPEPSTYALMALGVSVLLFARSRLKA